MPTFQWEVTRGQNPFVEARKFLILSQQELADELDVTEQYVYRLENGLVNTIGPRVYQTYSRLLSERDIVFSAQEMERNYEVWVKTMRSHIKTAFGGSDDRVLYGPRADVNHLRDEHPFITFMFNVTEHCARKFGLLYDNEQLDTRSQQLFARMLCIHPRAIQLYLAPRVSADLPPTLYRALLDAGFTAQTLTHLKREVALYSLRVYGRP